jgi:hypothetical protein
MVLSFQVLSVTSSWLGGCSCDSDLGKENVPSFVLVQVSGMQCAVFPLASIMFFQNSYYVLTKCGNRHVSVT